MHRAPYVRQRLLCGSSFLGYILHGCMPLRRDEYRAKPDVPSRGGRDRHLPIRSADSDDVGSNGGGAMRSGRPNIHPNSRSRTNCYSATVSAIPN